MPDRPLTSRARSEPARRRGFTITELIVVIGLIVLLIAVGIPAVGAMFTSGRLENATGTVSSAVAAARAFATKANVVDGGEYGYRGAAALFTDDHLIRIVRHNSYWGTGANAKPLYTDVVDPVSLHPDIAVVGLYGGSTTYITAPAFGVRFDKDGVLQTRVPSGSAYHDYMYYDANGDGDAADTNNGDYNGEPNVVGVIVYNQADMLSQVSGASALNAGEFLSSSDARFTWIMNNGYTLLFNRYSGGVVKE